MIGIRLDLKPWPKLCAACRTLVVRTPMKKLLNPNVADLAPADPAVTSYDEEHIITYLRLLDADAEGADWRDVSRIVMRIDPDTEADRARLAFESHLSRARWMTKQGYRHLLQTRRLIIATLPLPIALGYRNVTSVG